MNLSRYTLYENIQGNLYLVRFVIYSLIIGVQMKGYRCSVPTKEIIGRIGLIIAVTGILQFIFLPDLRFLQYQNWDDHLRRLTFPYLDPSFTGAILLVFLIINLFHGKGSSWRTPTIVIEIIAIFLTFSRATWVTGGIVLLMIIWRRRGIWEMRVIGITICIIVAVFIIFGKSGSYGNQLLRMETILSRTSGLQKGLQIWQKNPIFGVGFNHYKIYQLRNGYDVKNGLENRGEASVENSYIFVLATGGILSLAAFLLWVFGALRKSKGVYRYVFLTIMIASLFNNILFYPFMLLILFLVSV